MASTVGNPGFRIRYEIDRPDAALIAELARYSTCNIADAQGRFRVMCPAIKPVNQQIKLAGPAVTVLARPGDNLMVHKALEVAQPGDVVVVSTCGNDNAAVFGELMGSTLKGAKLGGLVVDGAVRDHDELLELGIAVFARSLVGSACDKDGPGEINFPVACGGVPVLPGDVVIGDANGVVIVPQADLAWVLAKTKQIVAGEEKRLAEIAAGQLFKAEIDATLRAKGVIS